MKTFKTMNLLLIFIMLLLSCHKNKTQPDKLPSNVSASEYFPNQVGDKWIYNIYDSVNVRMDEVSVEITGTTILPKGEVATIWVYKYPNKIDTNFVFQSGDTVKIVPALNLNPNDYYVSKKYVIPLTVGNVWKNTFVFDTIQVKKETEYKVNDLNFDSSYLMVEAGQTVNYLIYAEEYFKPKIGMIQLSKYEYNFFIPENKVWYLKEYFLK